jgi:hypothetical protein
MLIILARVCTQPCKVAHLHKVQRHSFSSQNRAGISLHYPKLLSDADGVPVAFAPGNFD